MLSETATYPSTSCSKSSTIAVSPHRGSFAPTDATVQGESYFDPRGPLSKEWRDGDSVWSLVAGDRLDRALSRLR